MTMSVDASGNWKLSANSVPNANVNSFNIVGTARTDGFGGNFTVGLTGGGTAAGTITINHTGR
jgi:hypothetical protein